MTARDRFLATIAFEPLDRPIMWECGFWSETIEKWRAQGLPVREGDQPGSEYHPAANDIAPDVWDYFGFDEYYSLIPIETRHLYPGFEEETIEESDTWILRRNKNGAVERISKINRESRALVKGSVSTRDDWERIKSEHIKPDLTGRAPENLDEIIEDARSGTRPIKGIKCEPWLNLGELLCLDRLLLLLAEDPEFIKVMFTDLTEFFLSLTDQLLQRITPDICWLGGDFCLKTGPMMSPEMFRYFLLPEFSKIADLYRSYGVPCIMMHTDGDCRPLIPQFIEAGATGVHPFETTNGQRIDEIRAEYPKFHIFGGIDKRAVAAGRESIDREIEAKLPGMIGRGGYIPYIDHAVPPDISWQDFVYYREKLARLVVAS